MIDIFVYNVTDFITTRALIMLHVFYAHSEGFKNKFDEPRRRCPQAKFCSLDSPPNRAAGSAMSGEGLCKTIRIWLRPEGHLTA